MATMLEAIGMGENQEEDRRVKLFYWLSGQNAASTLDGKNLAFVIYKMHQWCNKMRLLVPHSTALQQYELRLY